MAAVTDDPLGGYVQLSEGVSVPVVRLEGGPYDRGVQRGKQVPGMIRSRIERVRAAYDAVDGSASARATVARVEPMLRQRAPAFVEELQGIAKGGDLSWEDLTLAVMGRSVQNADAVNQHIAAQEDCSCMAASGPATKDGHLIMAKNADLMPPILDDQDYLILEVTPADGYRYRSIGVFPERPGQPEGMNEKGLAVIGAGQAPLDGQEAWERQTPIGPSVHDLQSRIYAECSTVDEAVDLLRSSLPGGYYGRVMFLGDATGAWAKIEISHRHIAVTKPDAASARSYVAMGVSGVFSDPAMAELLPAAAVRPWPYTRYDRYRHLIDSNMGAITLDVVKAILSDHDDRPGPDSICKHADGKTLGSTIYQPETGRTWLAKGAPCTAQFVELPKLAPRSH